MVKTSAIAFRILEVSDKARERPSFVRNLLLIEKKATEGLGESWSKMVSEIV